MTGNISDTMWNWNCDYKCAAHEHPKATWVLRPHPKLMAIDYVQKERSFAWLGAYRVRALRVRHLH